MRKRKTTKGTGKEEEEEKKGKEKGGEKKQKVRKSPQQSLMLKLWIRNHFQCDHFSGFEFVVPIDIPAIVVPKYQFLWQSSPFAKLLRMIRVPPKHCS